MKRFLFIISHLGSGSNIFCKILHENPRIQIYNSNIIYSHPVDLEVLKAKQHKLNNSAAIWGEEILYNHHFNGKSLYPFCKFIYFIREAKSSLFEIIKSKEDVEYMINYYNYRLRRMYEMSRQTGGLLVNCDDVEESFPLIQKYLNLKDALILSEKITKKKYNPLLNISQIENTEKVYEKYLFLLKQNLNWE